jgi:hypothetical protein
LYLLFLRSSGDQISAPYVQIGQINWSKSFKPILGFVPALSKQDRILKSAFFALLEALSFTFVKEPEEFKDHS